MASFDDLRRIARTLPEVEEADHFGGPELKVRGKTFALWWAETGRTILRLTPESGDIQQQRLGRLSAILGRDFPENAVPLNAEREQIKLGGWAGLPTYSRGNASHQYRKDRGNNHTAGKV